MNPATDVSIQTIHIRKAIAADLARIVDIYNDAIPGRMATADLEPIAIDSRLSWFHDRDWRKYPIWVAESMVNSNDLTNTSVGSGKSIMGWLSLQMFYGRCAYQGTAEVSIYVANRDQGKGVGKKLLNYAIANGTEIGINSLIGMIFAHNHPSLRLFQQSGFEKWGHLPQVARLDGVKRDLVILGLHLANA
jgi:L-amino acid N-acyltransferase YncA